ncbi:hypothetical protein [Planctomonas deserti]|uniref:hypothetical protein n=1 Tax=Planctomonas deserti TaxID=2144185 RepID=UPI000D3ABC7E|nr:hypothetical protein [Planctomonas deserti]
MAEILHLGALLPAAVSASCTVGAARSRGALGVISAIVMLAAMLDLTGGGVLSPLLWSALLVASAVGGALAARVSPVALRDGMRTHGALGLVVMAGLVVLMAGAGSAGTVPSGADPAGVHAPHAALAAGPLAGTVWAGTAAYLAFSCVLLRRPGAATVHAVAIPVPAARGGVRLRRTRHRGAVPRGWHRDRIEVAGMASSVALMAGALLA